MTSQITERMPGSGIPLPPCQLSKPTVCVPRIVTGEPKQEAARPKAMLIHSLKITNLLSFGPKSEEIKLNNLNVLIGPNGAGKSNLIEVFGLVKATSGGLAKFISYGGGIREWLWKGQKNAPQATIEVKIDNPGQMPLQHTISFAEDFYRTHIVYEKIANVQAGKNIKEPYVFYEFKEGRAALSPADNPTVLEPNDLNRTKSVIAQIKDPKLHPEITYLGNIYGKIYRYTGWTFGRSSPARSPQPADSPNHFLEEDASNLGLVINWLEHNTDIKPKLVHALQELYDEIDDVSIAVEGGRVQVFFNEKDFNGENFKIPAARISDGALRFLSLLAVLLHPQPPPLICIEEPELGLHPDLISVVAELLKDAAQRTQLVVTTHSIDLVDELSDMPEAVVVCEKHNCSTVMQHLEKDDLKVWLEKYQLGQLWQRGDIGGNRW